MVEPVRAPTTGRWLRNHWHPDNVGIIRANIKAAREDETTSMPSRTATVIKRPMSADPARMDAWKLYAVILLTIVTSCILV